jgi:predicted phage terminase large subunit-like protein
MFCTMNPDADSWLREFVDPWLAEDGYVDLDKNGKIFYFTVQDDQVIWVDADWRDSNGRPPKSVTYVNADIWDNPALLEHDPDYLSNLMSQSLVDRERFLGIKGRGGNWNIKAVAGKVFRADWFKVVDVPPSSVRVVRFWDFAASLAQHKGDDPDWTVGFKMCLVGDIPFGLHAVALRGTPAQVERALINTASQDGVGCPVRWFRDPGQAGIYQDAKLRSLLSGYDAAGILDGRDKYSRSKPLSAAAEFHGFQLLRGDWNQSCMNDMCSFPDGLHDDFTDSGSGAYNYLTSLVPGANQTQGSYRM